MKATTNRIPCNFRLTPAATKMLKATAMRMGLTKSAVIELAIRAYAKPEKPQ